MTHQVALGKVCFLADVLVCVRMCMFVGLLCADQQNELTLDASRNVIDMFSVSSLSSCLLTDVHNKKR